MSDRRTLPPGYRLERDPSTWDPDLAPYDVLLWAEPVTWGESWDLALAAAWRHYEAAQAQLEENERR